MSRATENKTKLFSTVWEVILNICPLPFSLLSLSVSHCISLSLFLFMEKQTALYTTSGQSNQFTERQGTEKELGERERDEKRSRQTDRQTERRTEIECYSFKGFQDSFPFPASQSACTLFP